MWNDIRGRQDMFEKETATLGAHSALVPAYTMLLFDVINVSSNMILCKLLRIEVVVVGKNIAHLGHIVADGHGGIGFSFQKRGKLKQVSLSGIFEGNSPQRVFFEFS